MMHGSLGMFSAHLQADVADDAQRPYQAVRQPFDIEVARVRLERGGEQHQRRVKRNPGYLNDKEDQGTDKDHGAESAD